MFGFTSLASYLYFGHLEQGFAEAFARRGLQAEVRIVDVQPTASIRRRAQRLVELINATGGESGPIHLVGHSTGGLDARLVASPSAHVGTELGPWIERIASVSTLSTPHYGTPLASFFATKSGQHMLHALSAFTIVALSLGKLPLSALSTLAAALVRSVNTVGLELQVLDRATRGMVDLLGPNGAREVTDYLRAIKDDQGGVIQLTPEAMDLFQAGIEDRPGVRYQCTVAMAPSPGMSTFFTKFPNPVHLASHGLFVALHKITARFDARYPCAAPYAGAEAERILLNAFGRAPGARANDGVVPLRSQIWGEVVWAGHGDHLDVLGHFAGPEAVGDGVLGHRDWMHSASDFDVARFRAMLEALVDGMLRATGG